MMYVNTYRIVTKASNTYEYVLVVLLTLRKFNKSMPSKNAQSQINLAKNIDKAMTYRHTIIDSTN